MSEISETNINSKENILGTGKVSSLFFKLAIPAVVAQVVNLLYNMVDRMYIGNMKEIGPLALTGIGVSTPLLMLLFAFAMLVGVGGAPRASIHLGAGENDKADAYINQAATLAILLGIVLTIVFSIFIEPLLLFFGASQNSLPYALEYSRIYLLGTVAVMFSLGMNYFISVQGFAKQAMITTVIGAILNIVLDPIFIFAFDLGVAGAAIATVISQYVSAIWVIHFLTSKKSYLKLTFKPFTLSAKFVLPILALGLSPFIMTATESLLQITFNRQLLKFGGDLYVGTMSINGLIMQMIVLPASGLAQGGISLISYNYGAKKVERIKEAVKVMMLANLSITFIATLIIELFPKFFVSIFVDDAALIAATVPTLRIYLIGISVFGIQISSQQAFIAFGQAKLSVIMALLRKIVLLIPLIFILPNFIKPEVFGIYTAEAVADILAATITATSFFTFYNKKIHYLENENLREKSVD